MQFCNNFDSAISIIVQYYFQWHFSLQLTNMFEVVVETNRMSVITGLMMNYNHEDTRETASFPGQRMQAGIRKVNEPILILMKQEMMGVVVASAELHLV